MKVINEEPMWSPYPNSRDAKFVMTSIDHDASFFMVTAPGDAPLQLWCAESDDEATTDVHMVNTRKANFGTMGTVAVGENTRLGPPIPMRHIDDLPSDGIPIAIGRVEPKLPVTPPSGSIRLRQRIASTECPKLSCKIHGDCCYPTICYSRRV